MTDIKTAKVKPEFSPDVVEALRTLRKIAWGGEVEEAVNILDNAGVFKAIDDYTNYDLDPAPEMHSKCTCPNSWWIGRTEHSTGCPGDPAEWGDLAYTTSEKKEKNDGR